MSRRCIPHLWVLLFGLTALLPAQAWAGAEDLLSGLKTRYLKLRNTDVEVTRLAEWELLAGEFENFAGAFPRHRDTPSALLNAAILLEQIHLRHGGQKRIERCLGLLARIPRDFPGHAQADDALLRRGDILRNVLKQDDEARRAFSEIAQAYKESDLYEAARARLRDMDSKAPKQQAAIDDTAVSPGAPVIVIDPGHGGEDFGAVGVGGLLEKDVVLAVAFELEKLLRSELGAVVRLTRRGDSFVPLAERTSLANDFEADVFISLHANASPSHKLSGVETYYLDNTNDQASQRMAEIENGSVRFEGTEGDLSYMLSDLVQNAKMDDSIKLARAVQLALTGHLRERWSSGQSLGVKKAPFYVLVGAHMPCVLVEMGFIDHKADGANLADRDYRHDLAWGIMLGVRSFLGGTRTAR